MDHTEKTRPFILQHEQNAYSIELYAQILEALDKSPSKVDVYTQLREQVPDEKSSAEDRLNYLKALKRDLPGIIGQHHFTNEELNGIAKLIRKERVLEHFFDTRDPKDEELIYQSLKAIGPASTTLDERLMLSDFIRDEAIQIAEAKNIHFGIFGTGGDRAHTINVSTITGILTAHILYDDAAIYKGSMEERLKLANAIPRNVFREVTTQNPSIIKIGTGAVTGKYGSKDVAGGATLYPPSESGSRYVSLGDMGYPYSEALIAARRRLSEDGITNDKLPPGKQQDPTIFLDPYKELFPGSNLSNAAHVVTGVADMRHLIHLQGIADHLGTNGVFVHSKQTGCDEILAGPNIVVERGYSGEWQTSEVYVGNPNDREYQKFMAERATLQEQKKAIIDVCMGNCPESVMEVFGYNAALVLMPARPESTLKEVVDEVKGFLLGQRKSPKETFIEAKKAFSK